MIKLHVEQFSVRGFTRIMSFDIVNLAHSMQPNILYTTHIAYVILIQCFLMNGQVFYMFSKTHMRFSAYGIYRICNLVLTEYMQFTFIYAYEDDDE